MPRHFAKPALNSQFYSHRSHTGTSKITRIGRVFSPEISPKTVATHVIITTATPTDIASDTPIVIPTVDTRGKEALVESAQAREHPEVILEASRKEIEEILKIIKKSDYNIVEQLGQTPSKISLLSLLLCSETHAKALVKFLKTAHVPQETSIDQFENCVASLTVYNGLGFFDVDLTSKGKKHNDALHISIECRGTTLAHVLVDTGSSLNVLPKNALDQLDCKGLILKPCCDRWIWN